MRAVKPWFILVAALLVLLTAASAAAGPPDPGRRMTTPDTPIWQLSGLSVTSAGQIVAMAPDPDSGFAGGILMRGYTLEGKAKAKAGKLVPEGTVRIVLSAFRPNADLPGQRAGLWYVQGDWTIVDKNATHEAKKARHNPYTVSGKVQAELEFNPGAEQRAWTARASLPMSTAAGLWSRGKGVLVLDEQLQGELRLDVQLWPEIRPGRTQ